MEKIIKFGEDVEGYAIPVLNEREIRAAAGMMFLALSAALVMIMFKQDFLLVKYVIVIFLTDFFIRVFISPRFSPMLSLFIMKRRMLSVFSSTLHTCSFDLSEKV